MPDRQQLVKGNAIRGASVFVAFPPQSVGARVFGRGYSDRFHIGRAGYPDAAVASCGSRWHTCCGSGVRIYLEYRKDTCIQATLDSVDIAFKSLLVPHNKFIGPTVT